VSTVSSRVSRELATRVRACAATMLDAPVSGSVLLIAMISATLGSAAG
jgi:3-hydroxyisobutyrate dehydrogenase-like beta-hydroxyacid dehydrogenase